ncbi:MAG: PEGA domain-containing protein [Planctomycetes bacterium]|nr:PEGA domain-containing protein [Planctomycetota bacterium]
MTKFQDTNNKQIPNHKIQIPNVWLLFLSAWLLLCTGCATAISGTTQRIKINTKPEGATVVIEETCGKKVSMVVTTPAKVTLERRYEYHLKVDKKGYYPVTRGIRRGPNNAMIIDGVLLPIHCVGTTIGMVSALVDHFTGAIWTLYPAEINIELEPSNP